MRGEKHLRANDWHRLDGSIARKSTTPKSEVRPSSAPLVSSSRTQCTCPSNQQEGITLRVSIGRSPSSVGQPRSSPPPTCRPPSRSPTSSGHVFVLSSHFNRQKRPATPDASPTLHTSARLPRQYHQAGSPLEDENWMAFLPMTHRKTFSQPSIQTEDPATTL